MTEILRVFNEIYKPGCDYCVICLRTATERRLVSTQHLELFIKSINLPWMYGESFQKICYLCSRAAKAAYKFRLATNMASWYHNMFRCLMQKRSYNHMADQLLGKKAKTGLITSSEEWESKLIEFRSKTQLLLTEVLVVDSLVNQPIRHGRLEEEPDHPGSCEDMYLVPDAPPQSTPVERLMPEEPPSSGPHTITPNIPSKPRLSDNVAPMMPAATRDPVHDVLLEPEIYMDSVVIIDEDDDPIDIKTENHDQEDPLNQFISNGQIQQSDKNLSAGKEVVASGQCLQSDETSILGQLLPYSVTDVGEQPTDFLLHPIVEKNGVLTVPSLAAEILNGKLVSAGGSSVVLTDPKVAMQDGQNINLLTDRNQVTSVLNSMSKSNLSNVAIVSNDIDVNILQNNVLHSLGNLCNVTNLTQQGDIVPIMETINTGTFIGNTENLNTGDIIENFIPGKESNTNPPDIRPIQPETNILEKLLKLSPDSFQTKDSDLFESRIGNVEGQSEKADGKRQQNEIENVKRLKRVIGKSTDWEDKIPMDVISFMDATDPYAPKVIAPNTSLGVITNVKSVAEQTTVRSAKKNQLSKVNKSSSNHFSVVSIPGHQNVENSNQVQNRSTRKVALAKPKDTDSEIVIDLC